MKKIISLLIILALALPLTSCDSLIRIDYKDGFYIDSVNNIRYINASVSYEPVSVGEEYAKYDKTVLYKMPNTNPTQWMTEAYEGIGSVFYAEDVTLPALSDFQTKEVYICSSEVKTIGIGTVDDPTVIAALVDAIENGEQSEAGSSSDSYYLKFVSDAYPFLYYSVVFIVADNGGHYVYDRGTKRCVAIGDLLKTYMPEN